MKLRTQLLLAGAITLLLPLLAYRAVHQLDTALRQSRSDDLVERTHAAAALANVSGLLPAMNVASGGAKIEDAGLESATLIYAERLRHSIFLDGYDDDWVSLRQPARRFDFATNAADDVADNGSLSDTRQFRNGRPADSNATFKLRTAVSGAGLYLYLEVMDEQIVMHDPSLGLLSTGDHVEVFWESGGGETVRRVFRAVAPGLMQGHFYGPRFEGLQAVLIDSKTRGVFEVSNNGYQMELRIPLPASNSRFGIAVVDRDTPEDTAEPGDEYTKDMRWAGTFDPASGPVSADFVAASANGVLVYPSAELRRLMADVVPPGSRLRVFDRGGRLRTDVNRLYEREAASELIDPQKTHFFNAVLFRFFEWIIRKQQLAKDQPFTADRIYLLDQVASAGQPEVAKDVAADADARGQPRSYITLGRDHVIGALEALHSDTAGDPFGWILYETNEDNTNAFTSSAMVRVFSLVTAVSMLVALSLLTFATWLSFRIRRLSKAARSVVSEDGKFVGAIKGSRSRDEIGDLSRDFASLVDRSRGYTQYLESLSSKLSHELRTPLSVVQTSLENIDHDSMAAGNRDLLLRAQDGSEQLGKLLRSMSEAARLEQSIAAAEFQQIDLAAWLLGLTDVYRDIYPQWEFECRLPEQPVQPVVAQVVPELLLQALDKLVSNSTDFTAVGSTIVLQLQADADRARFAVENPGSRLPEAIRDTLFDPMVTSRSAVSGSTINDSTATEQPSGKAPHLGLGLYIVRLVAECHQGMPYAGNTHHGVNIGFSLRRKPKAQQI